MSTDRKRLQHGSLIQRHPFRLDQMCYRNGDALSHTPIRVNTEHFQLHTAVRFAFPAGDAASAMHIRNDRYRITFTQTRIIVPDSLDHAGELVSKNARVGKKGLSALVRMHIRAADPDAANPYNSFSMDKGRLGHIDHRQLIRLFTNDAFHRSFLP
ncbi:hypothetical protein D3C73_1334040 [compost metagenome]